jgi:hypothetical protein
MSFLDQLKQQAQQRQAQDRHDVAEIERRIAMTEAACATAWRYLDEMGRQLDVLQPVSRHRYVIDNRCIVESLPLTGFTGDIRKQTVQLGPLAERSLVQHVILRAVLRSGREVELSKDFPPEIDKLEGRLKQAGIQALGDSLRDAETGRFEAMRFRFVADIAVTVRVLPLHEEGQVQFELKNLDGLSTVTATFAAFDITSARLDELAKWFVGQPHRFLEGAVSQRRHEPA